MGAPSLEQIVRVVAEEFGVAQHALLGHDRHRTPVMARHVAFYVARTLTAWSFPEIGRHFGGRDHTTVISGHSKVDQLVARDAAFAARVDSLVAALSALSAPEPPAALPGVVVARELARALEDAEAAVARARRAVEEVEARLVIARGAVETVNGVGKVIA